MSILKKQMTEQEVYTIINSELDKRLSGYLNNSKKDTDSEFLQNLKDTSEKYMQDFRFCIWNINGARYIHNDMAVSLQGRKDEKVEEVEEECSNRGIRQLELMGNASEILNVISKRHLDMYEKYYLLYYIYSYYNFVKKIDPKLTSLDSMVEIVTLLRVLSCNFTNGIFNYTKRVKSLEKQLTNQKSVRQIAKKTYEKHGYTTFEIHDLYFSKDIYDIFKKFFIKTLNDMKNALNKINIDTLEKPYYIKNLELYCKSINSPKPHFQIAHYLILDNITKIDQVFKIFNGRLVTSSLTSSTTSLFFIKKILNIKSDVSFSFEHSNLFCTHNDLFYTHNDLDDLEVIAKVLFNIFIKRKSDITIIDDFVKKIEDDNLTGDDFKYFKQFDYVKEILKNALANNQKGINILFYGKPGTGKSALAKTLIKEINATGYKVDNSKSTGLHFDQSNMKKNEDTTNTSRINNYAFLQSFLQSSKNSVIVYDEAEDFFNKKDDVSQSKEYINNCLENNNIPVIWTANDLWCITESFRRRFTFAFNIDQIPISAYQKIINKFSQELHIELPKNIQNEIIEYKPNIGTLKNVLNNYSRCGNNDYKRLIDNLLEALKCQNCGEEVKKIKPKRPVNFNIDLLNTSDDLKTFTNKIVKLNRLDFSLLLYGVSGGGKSFYAEYLAEQLGIPVIKKKASDLESMWVGETEHNIARAFEEARINKAMLVIDEGDHFISDRSKHMHSWETSRSEEMLQQIEMHEYPVIFTTNLIKNVDKAAMRRFTYKTEFNYLTKDQVKLAWKIYFPEAKLPKDIYLSKLCPGDFSTVKKRAEFEDYLTDTDKLYQSLENEIAMKKEDIEKTINL